MNINVSETNGTSFISFQCDHCSPTMTADKTGACYDFAGIGLCQECFEELCEAILNMEW